MEKVNNFRDLTEKGFSLLEVMIALIILAGATIAVCQAFSSGILASGDVENVDLALNIAQAKAEVLKNNGFAALADSGPATDPNFSNFNVTVNVAEGQNPMQADVTVAWNVPGGQTNVTLTTLIANY